MENNLDKYPIHSIFILILIISANFLTQLFPCRLQKILTKNIYIKHIFAFLSLTFFVVLTAPLDDKSLKNIFQKSFILYILFILIMRTDKYFFIIILFLIALIYILVLKENEYKSIIEKNNLKDKEKDEINKNIIDIKKINDILFYIVIIITIIGFLIYLGEKKYEKKNNFCFSSFFFGQYECKFDNDNISYKKAINSILS